MGLALVCKGFVTAEQHTVLNCSYSFFTKYRFMLCEAKNKRLGQLYKQWYESYFPHTSQVKLTEQQLAELESLLGNLIILVNHSDCDGKLTPKESGLLFKEIKDLKLNDPCKIFEYYHKTFMELLRFSKTNRRQINFF